MIEDDEGVGRFPEFPKEGYARIVTGCKSIQSYLREHDGKYKSAEIQNAFEFFCVNGNFYLDLEKKSKYLQNSLHRLQTSQIDLINDKVGLKKTEVTIPKAMMTNLFEDFKHAYSIEEILNDSYEPDEEAMIQGDRINRLTRGLAATNNLYEVWMLSKSLTEELKSVDKRISVCYRTPKSVLRNVKKIFEFSLGKKEIKYYITGAFNVAGLKEI